MNSQFSTLTRKLIVFSVFLALVLGSLGMASPTPAIAQELPPQTPSGEPIHYLVDGNGNVRISPHFFAETENTILADFPNAACVNAPTLLGPANGSVLNTLIPKLQWNTGGEPNASGIRVMLSEDASFASAWSSMTAWFLLTDWEISNNLKPATTYYWRAQFLCGDARADGPFSNVWSFTTGSGGIMLVAPVLTSPDDRSTVAAPTILKWQPVSGATLYQVIWREVGRLGYTYDFTDQPFYEPWGLATDVEYEWWVKARNDYAYGPSTTTWKFRLVEPTFSDVPGNYWAWSFVERLYNAGITGGCATTPNLLYCPDATVTRAQMAVFLLKSMHGPTFVPPLVGDSTGFGDVATSHWAAPWIKQLAAEGITGGCGAGIYCPESPVTRAQMAVFLLKAKNSSGYIPPLIGDGSGFTDVPDNYWAAVWIKQLAADGITGGCGAGIYCPENPVTRAQMAVFIVKTFGLP